MQKLKRKHRGFENKKALYGVAFITPWLIGIAAFFIIPLFKSVWYAFSDVTFGDKGGIVTKFSGLYNFNYIFRKDPDFLTNLGDSISSFITTFPMVIVLSLIFALVLNQKFHGRTFARAIFFLPVIIATGVVMKNLTASVSGQPAIDSLGSTGGYSVTSINFDDILGELNLPEEVIKLISDYINATFNIVWKTGIQVVLFLSGLQTIPDQLYEVSKIEGASKWEEFWFITIPMLKNIILLVMLYTMVDLLVTVDNTVVSQAYTLVSSASYGLSSAMLWSFLVIVLLIIGIILFVYKKFCMDRW